MQMPGMLASLGRAELLMAAGAALVVIVDVLFSVFGPYGFSNVAWAAAVFVLLLIFVNSRMLGFSATTTRSLLLMLGLFAGIALVRDILLDLQFLNGANVATTYFIGLVGYYAGAILIVFGAWTLWKGKAA
jgi:hypothetical protein